MDELERILKRAWDIFVEDPSDETGDEVSGLIPQLVDAGYVAIDGESESGFFCRFTQAGVERAEALGFD